MRSRRMPNPGSRPERPEEEADGDAKALDLRGVLDELLARTEGEELTVEDALRAYGSKAYGPLILIPAILLTLPTGALPGMPLVLGAIIFLICLQALFGRQQPWIPRRLGKIKVSRSALSAFRVAADGWLSRIDTVIKPRATFLVRPPMTRLVALFCCLLAVALIPVEVVPFATAVPGSALVLFGLALTAHDGYLVAGGMAAMGATVWLLGALAM